MKRALAAIAAATALLAGLAVAAPAARAGAPASYNDLFDSHSIPVSGDYEPLLFGCRVGEGSAHMLWYAAGPATDHLWTFSPSEDELVYSSAPMSVNGVYEPVIGDFDGDGCDDIVWYAPGTAADYIWWGDLDGSFTSAPLTINGTYEPVAGWFTEAERDSIFWYSPGSGPEYVWTLDGDRSFTSKKTPPVNGTYRIASSFETILFHRPGPGTDYLWSGLDATTGEVAENVATQINGTYEPQAGLEGFLLYGPGSAPDYLLWNVDTDGNPETIPATINGTYETGKRSQFFAPVHIWHAPGAAPDYLWTPARPRVDERSVAPSERTGFGQR